MDFKKLIIDLTFEGVLDVDITKKFYKSDSEVTYIDIVNTIKEQIEKVKQETKVYKSQFEKESKKLFKCKVLKEKAEGDCKRLSDELMEKNTKLHLFESRLLEDVAFSYSSVFDKHKQNTKNCGEFWTYIPKLKEDIKIGDDLQCYIKELAGESSEAGIQSKLMKIFQSLVQSPQSIFHDTHEKSTIGSLKPDWCVTQLYVYTQPYWVDLVGETKIDSKLNSNATYGQVFQYLKFLLLSCPSSTTKFGFIISNIQIVFISASRQNKENYLFEITASYPLFIAYSIGKNTKYLPGEGLVKLKQLASYCYASRDHIPKDIIEIGKNKLIKAVGSGTSSEVFTIQGDSVYKVFKPDSIKYKKVEEDALRSLQSIPGIPKLGKTSENWIQISPLCEPASFAISCLEFDKFIDTAQAFHTKGYVHRDIRVSNLLLKKERYGNVVYLVDWAFSVKKGTSNPYNGTLYTASDRILEKLDKKELDFECFPSDDLISLIRTFIQLKHEGIRGYLMKYQTPGEIIAAWRGAPISSFYSRLIDEIPTGFVPKKVYDSIKQTLL